MRGKNTPNRNCRRSVALRLLAAALLIGLAAGNVFGESPSRGSLRIVGSTTIQPLVENIAAAYQEESGVTLDIIGGGSGAGFEALGEGTADVGMASRSLTPEEREKFSYATIGYDALAIIVNRENPRERITTGELLEIYTGRINTWDQAPQWAAQIVLISKQSGRGTLAVFEGYTGLLSPAHDDADTGEGELIAVDAWEAGANIDTILWVGGIPAAIGYVSLGAADRFIEMGQPIRKLILDNVPAEVKMIESGRYPMVRELNLVYRNGDEAAADLVRYMRQSEQGRGSVRGLGYVPAASSLEAKSR